MPPRPGGTATRSHELAVVGITGTDGKTTTAFLAVAALEAAGVADRDDRHGRDPDRRPRRSPTRRTPRPPTPRTSRPRSGRWSDAGDRAAVVETTSHGLALERVGSIAYDVAILTNVTHEHLEFHGTWEAYRDAKLSLFERLAVRPRAPRRSQRTGRGRRTGIVNLDDPSAGRFIGVTQEAGARVLTYGTDPAADVRATRVEEDVRRPADLVHVARRAPGDLSLRLAGRFNVHNALAVVALGEAAGLDPEAVRAGLAGLEAVPGRMERVEAGQPFGVIVDYAHSPASLQSVLDLLAPVAAARGGGLDRGLRVGRRARHREAADHGPDRRRAGPPRGRDRRGPARRGSRGHHRGHRPRRGGRRQATRPRSPAHRGPSGGDLGGAASAPDPGDIVLLAGKGHERSIIGPTGPVAWNERTVAEAALRELGFG